MGPSLRSDLQSCILSPLGKPAFTGQSLVNAAGNWCPSGVLSIAACSRFAAGIGHLPFGQHLLREQLRLWSQLLVRLHDHQCRLRFYTTLA